MQNRVQTTRAGTLNSLDNLHADQVSVAKTIEHNVACKRINRAELTREKPATYETDLVHIDLQLAHDLNALGLQLAKERRYVEAIKAYEDMLAIVRELSRFDSTTFSPDVAGTLKNLGLLLRQEHRYVNAREAWDEALQIFEELAKVSHEKSRPEIERLRNLIGDLPKRPPSVKHTRAGSGQRPRKPRAE